MKEEDKKQENVEIKDQPEQVIVDQPDLSQEEALISQDEKQEDIDIDDRNQGIEEPEEHEEEEKSDSIVATASGQKKLLLVFLLAIGIGALYYFVFASGSDAEKDNKDSNKVAAKTGKYIIESSVPVTASTEETKVESSKVKAPKVLPLKDPTPPKPPEPPTPKPPPPPVFSTQPESSDSGSAVSSKGVFSPFGPSKKEEEEKKQAFDNRRKASIMVMGGGGKSGLASLTGASSKKGTDSAKEKDYKKTDYLGFGDGALDDDTLEKTSAEQVKATKVGQLNRMILQGKVVHAVLETAINTDIPGILRAIVSRDVYAESGGNILITKGSRLVGTYNSQIKAGQIRVAVIWNRLIRPDGIDIQIDSAGTDQLGRGGIAGEVYNKFWTKIANAFMVSYVVPIAASQAAKKMANMKTTPISRTDDPKTGTTTIQTDSDSAIIQDSTKQFSDVVKEAVKDSAALTPTITVDQGTVINVLVQKDLIFPKDALGGILLSR